MRVSSVIRPSSSGTLKSARTNTRVPFKSERSLTVRFPIVETVEGSAPIARRHVTNQVLHPVREAPLVVVPGEDLGQVAVDHLGERGVDDGRVRVAAEVDRDQLLVRTVEVALL